MSDVKTSGFVVKCEIPGNKVAITRDNPETVRIPFNVTRQEDGPARIEALIIPLDGPPGEVSGQPLPPERWGHWLSLEGDPEQVFDDAGFRNYTVLLNLPSDSMAPLGAYQFKLRVLGVDDPDEQFDESEIVTLEITGKKPSPTVFAIIAFVLLAVIVGVIVAAALYFMSRGALNVSLNAPSEVQVGQTAPYILYINNPRSKAVTDVTVEYVPPTGVLGATINVRGATYRQCQKADRTGRIYCDLGALDAEQEVILDLSVIPGPTMTTLTNTNVMTVTCDQLERPIVVNPKRDKITSVQPADDRVSVVMEPSVGLASIGEEMTVDLMAWSNDGPLSESYTVIYRLPQGMKYSESPFRGGNCEYRSYFEVQCDLPQSFWEGDVTQTQVATINLIPTHVTVDPPVHFVEIHDVENNESVVSAPPLVLPVVETFLTFDGIDDYAELGYAGIPESFTVGMWVEPESTDDGQNFIGVHDLEGHNLLLVGYYQNGLHVNLRDTRITFAGAKTTDRQHMAVAVNKVRSDNSEVFLYLNDELQDLFYCKYQGDDGYTQIILFRTISLWWFRCPGGLPPQRSSEVPITVDHVFGIPAAETKPWVLGQDWDPGLFGPVPSDFLNGSISNVRLWQAARMPGSLLEEEDLIGHWPMFPSPVVGGKDLILLEKGPDSPAQSGERFGANWQHQTLFGTALQFDGESDYALAYDLYLGSESVLTFAAWVYVTDRPSQDQWMVGQTAIGGLIIDKYGYAAVVARSIQGESRVWAELPDRKPIPTHRWVHYAGVVAQTQGGVRLKLYRNGVEVRNDVNDDRVSISVEDAAEYLHVGGVGNFGASTYAFKGQLDDVRIWNRDLSVTPSEIVSWMSRPGEFHDEVAYWPFDDGPGRQVTRGNCTLEQSCNQSAVMGGNNDRGHLNLMAPTWVDSTLSLGDIPGMGYNEP